MNRRLLLLTLPFLGIASCSSPNNVFVVDEKGKPVEGAVLYGTWPSTQGPLTTTDRNGAARIEISETSVRPRMMAFSVSKPGYKSFQVLELKDGEVFRITLRPPTP